MFHADVCNIFDDVTPLPFTPTQAKLRTMIAAVVTKQDSMQSSSNIPPPPPLPNFGAAAGGPPPPPPPLPGMDFMLSGHSRKESMAELVAKNRKGQKKKMAANTRGPSMMDILAGLGSVQLKKAGDRGASDEQDDDSAAPMDAGAMIAAALKKKFAHRVNVRNPL